MKPLLLWTERPVPIARELETHAWMLANLSWLGERFEIVYDNAPGDWMHYSETFRAVWARAGRERRSFFNLESDVVPTREALQGMLECPESICMTVNPIFDFRTGQLLGHSAVTEIRIPGGWDAHLSRVGETWAEYADLGLVKFGYQVTPLDLAPVPPLTANDGMLNMHLFEFLRLRVRREHLVHLHWPAVKNNHLGWDQGDYAHHPPGFKSPYEA